jgi:hypothetical protein
MSDSSSGGRRSSAKQHSKKAKQKKNVARKDELASEGVLANLPRTRPQRGSARRDAARRTAAATQAKPASQAKRVAQKTPTAKQRPSRAKPTAQQIQDPAPRQGFEAESEHLNGPVQPPGGVDLFASAAELAGELTKSGLSAGGRLLKDALARLPLN